MFEIQNYASFIVAILLFQMVPGAGTLAILNASARHGPKAGMGVVAGTLAGDFCYMVGAMIGLAAIMQAHPVAFELLQWIGSAYLCWMGWQLLRSAGASQAPGSPEANRVGVHMRQGFLVSVTNPKVMLFFLAFFPLFLRPDASSLTLAAMMAHVTLISLLYELLLVWLGNTAARKLSRWPSLRRLALRVAGIALLGFGIKLALNR